MDQIVIFEKFADWDRFKCENYGLRENDYDFVDSRLIFMLLSIFFVKEHE